MASPFTIIRKYDKVLLAVFGVLLMLSFLIADPLSMMTSRGGGSSGAPSTAPVTFKGGSLSEGQLQRMHLADMLADAFLRRVMEEANKNKAEPRMFPHLGGAFSEAQLVENYLLAKKAHELGLSMSNDDIDNLIANMAGDGVDKDEIRKIRKQVLDDEAGSVVILSEQDLYSQLRTNFLAQEVLSMVRSSAQSLQMEQQYAQFGLTAPGTNVTLPPAEAWEMFRRTARQAKVELLPLEVEKFLDDVSTNPTPRQKDEIFEKYKDTPPTPVSPDPGLAVPHKIAFGYVRVDFQPFLDRAKAEITEEAIRAEYDERLKKGELTVPVEKKEGENEEKEEKVDETRPEDAQPAPEGAKPEEQPKDEKTDEKPEEPKDNEKKDDAAPGDKPCQDNSEQESATQDAEPKETKEETATEKSEENAKPETKDEGKPEDETSPEGTKPEEKKPDEKKVETRDKTYEEMEETIREQLAQKPAQDAQRDAMDELFKALEEYHAKYNEWTIEKEAAASAKGKEKTALPDQPELLPVISGVLKKYGFKFQQTELLDVFEIADTEIGKASVGQGAQSFPLQQIYLFDVKLYQAFAASEGFLRDTQYLLWKEADQAPRSAERKEVEEQLVRAVKMQEAFKLAKAQAEELAAKARERADKSLLTSLGPVDKAAAVVEPQPFSWLSSGFVPGGMGMRAQPTEIPEVPYPGDEFMQTVLDLQPGEIGVAADQPHKRVYVIRLISQTPQEDILRQMFLTKGITDQNVSQQYNQQRMQSLETWLDNVVNKEMQRKWNRRPQSYSSM